MQSRTTGTLISQTMGFPIDQLHRPIEGARTSLEAYRARSVIITGASRLSTHFAVGNELADGRRWVLSVNQRGQMWTTDATPAQRWSQTSSPINPLGLAPTWP